MEKIPSKRIGVWNNIPIRRLVVSTFILVTSSPSRNTEFAGGSHSLLRHRNSVDLPLPLGPIMPTTCPACTFNETPDSKGTPVSENLSKFTTLTLAPDRRCSDLLKYTSTGIESRCSLTSPSSPDPFPTNRIKSHLFRSQLLRGKKKATKVYALWTLLRKQDPRKEPLKLLIFTTLQSNTSLPDPSQKAHNAQKPKQASNAASLSGKRNDPNQPTSIAHNKTDLICSTRYRIFHQEPEKIPDQNREEGNKTRKEKKKQQQQQLEKRRSHNRLTVSGWCHGSIPAMLLLIFLKKKSSPLR